MRVVASTANEVDTGTALKTILQVLVGAQGGRMVEFGISFKGTDSGGTPILVTIATQTSAGTGGVAVTERKIDRQNSVAIVGSALEGPAAAVWTAEPTLGEILMPIYIHPNSGAWHYVAPDPDEFTLAANERIALMTTAAANIKCKAWIKWDE